MALFSQNHVKYVLTLYKNILKLHRGLPTPMQTLGNQYLREEFKRHSNVKPEEAAVFLYEWTHYAAQLSDQLKTSYHKTPSVGVGLSEHQLSDFQDSQIGQLYELLKEIKKPNSQSEIPDK